MSDAAKPDPDDSGRGPTPVPPRGGKGKGGAKRPAPSRPVAKNVNTKGRQARQAAQRRNRGYVVLGAVLAAVAIVAVVLVATGGGSGAPRKPAPIAAVTQMENIPTSTLVAASTLGIQQNYAQKASGPAPAPVGGKPTVLFIGAEFCPICAAERWPMTLALMKFGKFTNLQQTHSAKADGNAGTWSYEGATYTSQYLNFQPYELYTNQVSGSYYKALDKAPADAQAIWTANLGSNLTFPFIDIAGKEVLATAQFNPSALYNHSFGTTLGAIGTNDNTVGAAVDAAAAVFVKYLCGATGNQPSDVCSAATSVNAPVTQGSSGGSSTPAGG